MSKKREVSILVDAKNKARGVFLEVKKDLRGLGEESKKSLGTFSDNIGKVDKGIMSFAGKMKGLDKVVKRTFQGAAASAGVYVGATLRDFSQLNDGISKVNTLYEQTGESQKKMYQDSMKMFKMLPTDFNKITQGIYDTISAGADPKDATRMARKFGMAGVAGDSDMDVVTKAAMGTMNAYKLEAKDLTGILDLQFMTVKRGITSYSELASSLGTGVLASAKGSGISLQELYGSIAMITKNAIPANIATTSLNQLFNKFTDTKAIKEFKEFGVEIQDSKKNTRPLIEILKELNLQFDKKGMSSESRKGYLKTLLGSDEAARAILPLLGDLKEFQSIMGDMDNSSGAMRGAYDDRLESMKTQIQMFWNGLKSTGIEQVYKLDPLMKAIMKPMIQRAKLEVDIQDLEEAMEYEKQPLKKKMYREEIETLKLELENTGIPPVNEFRDALAESTTELNKFSPTVGGIVDKLGNFILDFVGEEGKENRDTAGNVAKGLFAVQALSWGSRKVRDVTGKTPWELGSWAISKTFELGKGAIETGYLQALYALDALTAAGYSLSGVLGGIVLPVVGAGTVLYNEKKINDRAKEVKENPDNFRYSFTEKKWFSLEELDKLNQEKKEKDMQNNVTIGPATGKLRPALKEQGIPGKNQNRDKTKQAVNLMNTKAMDELIKASMPNLNQQKVQPKLVNTKLVDDLLKINQVQDKINNTINMENKITVEPPKVGVYVDSKHIPIQRIEVSGGKVDYSSVEKHSEVQARRYGKPQSMLY